MQLKGEVVATWRRFRQPMKTDCPVHRLAKSIPWNRFPGSLNIYKFGLMCSHVGLYHVCEMLKYRTRCIRCSGVAWKPKQYSKCYHLVLSCDVIKVLTHLFFIFPENLTHTFFVIFILFKRLIIIISICRTCETTTIST